MNLIVENGPYSQFSLCLTLAILLFAIAIIRNGWGIGYRLSLIPASLMPLLIGFGTAGFNLMGQFTRGHGRYDAGIVFHVVREYTIILPFCLFQTVLLLGVTAYAFLDLKNGPLAALITTRPAAD